MKDSDTAFVSTMQIQWMFSSKDRCSLQWWYRQNHGHEVCQLQKLPSTFLHPQSLPSNHLKESCDLRSINRLEAILGKVEGRRWPVRGSKVGGFWMNHFPVDLEVSFKRSSADRFHIWWFRKNGTYLFSWKSHLGLCKQKNYVLSHLTVEQHFFIRTMI